MLRSDILTSTFSYANKKSTARTWNTDKKVIAYTMKNEIPAEKNAPQKEAPSRNVVVSKPFRYFLKYGSLKLAIAPLLNFMVVTIIEGTVDIAINVPTRRTATIPAMRLALNLLQQEVYC